jgi:hypothetical protein
VVPGGDLLGDGADIAAAAEQGLDLAGRRPPVSMPERVPVRLLFEVATLVGFLRRPAPTSSGDRLAKGCASRPKASRSKGESTHVKA